MDSRRKELAIHLLAAATSVVSRGGPLLPEEEHALVARLKVRSEPLGKWAEDFLATVPVGSQPVQGPRGGPEGDPQHERYGRG